jgi:CPA2 family monovalent cation:H+ antiporter-2
LFALIFFVSVGMLFDPVFFVSHTGSIFALAAALVVSKALITTATVKRFGYSQAVSWLAGLGLSQIGEFAFLIAKAGNSSGQLSTNSFSLIIAVTVVSMIATPLLFWLAAKIASHSENKKRTDGPYAQPDLSVTHSGHVIIIGAGVVGQYVARVLTTLERPYVAVEMDHTIVTICATVVFRSFLAMGHAG